MDPVFGYPLIITHKPTRKESDYYNVYRINPDSLQDGGGLKISLEYTDRQEHREEMLNMLIIIIIQYLWM